MKEQISADKDFNFRDFFKNIISNWYLFVVAITLFLTTAFLYNRYAAPEFKINSKLLVQEQKNNSPQSQSDQVNNISPGFTFQSNAQNEIQILTSRKLIDQVVNELHLNTKLFRKKGLQNIELFKEAPFRVMVANKLKNIRKEYFEAEILKGNKIRLTNKDENLDKVLKPGEVLNLSQYTLFFVQNTPGLAEPGQKYILEIQSFDEAAEDLMNRIEATFPAKDATVINLTLSYPNPEKGEAILRQLLNFYLANEKLDQVRIADSTLQFIDNRLSIVSAQLNQVEQNLENYRSSNSIADLDEQSKVLVGTANDYYKKLQDQDIQLSVIKDLQEYLKNPQNTHVIPASLTIQNSSFETGIERYNELLLERERQNLSYTSSNPVIQNIDNQIESLRKNLLQNIDSYKNEIQLSRDELVNQNKGFHNKIQEIPGKERVFLDYTRQQNLKQQLYLYLLQRREEAAIAKTSNIENSRIIDIPKAETKPFKPQKLLIYILALVLGTVFPLAYIYLSKAFNSKITTAEDVETATDAPVIGEIAQGTFANKLAVYPGSRTLIAETFKTLRANLQSVLPGGEHNVILVTSGIRNEGKTFLSCNLAASLSMAGKKVLLLELDLRKPQLLAYLKASANIGFTDYVTDDADPDSVIYPAGINENYFILPAGTIPENPSEMLLSPKLEILISRLKSQFDYVIIDSPPFGLVSDALLIEKFSNCTLYLTRINHTDKSNLEKITRLKELIGLKKLFVVVNGVIASKNSYYASNYYEPEDRPGQTLSLKPKYLAANK